MTSPAGAAQPDGSCAAYIALGSNLDDRSGHLATALSALDAHEAIRLDRVSTILETEPVGPGPQSAYLNACAAAVTTLGPEELLEAMLAIERAAGRDRSRERRWGPRTLDLDLLLYENRRLERPGLTLPHPRLHERLFVLEPLAEIAGHVIVPGLDETVSALLERLRAAPRRGEHAGPDTLQP